MSEPNPFQPPLSRVADVQVNQPAPAETPRARPQRPLPISILTTSGIVLLVVIAFVAFGAIDTRTKFLGMPEWYFPCMFTGLVAWVIAMIGLFKMKKWAAQLALGALFLNQVLPALVGVWQLKHMMLLLLALIIVPYWKRYV